jgi:hypothetical protein
MANVTNYVSKKISSGTTEGNVALNVKEFKLISNESANTITINFDNATTEEGAIELLTGQSIENFRVFCKTLYHKASGASSTLKVIGMIE